MTHVLRTSELYATRPIGKRRAAVHVRLEKNRLVIVVGHIAVLDDSAQVVPVPERLLVVDEDGEVVEPSDGAMFLMTTETFDPYHIVTQLPKSEWR